ncbi:hypothetical protein G4D82_05725 [Flavobacterium sp. CYK-4]|uniref:hypothetical protein n=1 Tax=Flavobacterium lotistagni TaxID=2709660 RepID=UPI00140D1AF3|nr:hypothetical protein [Flavobacterium lotistagni]NHM06711.1 hypothetical protein [Flavobacterium lotistagni]
MRFIKIAACLLLILSGVGCKINQYKDKQKQGRWVYRDTVNGIVYLTKGKYKKGMEKKTWKYYAGKTLIKKEKYEHEICRVTTYHDNGAISSLGQTKLVVTETEMHWYYFDQWYYFDPNGKPIAVKKYENGTLVQETETN